MDIWIVFTFAMSCTTAFQLPLKETHAGLNSDRECWAKGLFYIIKK